MEDKESEMALDREEGELEDGELDDDDDTLPPALTPALSRPPDHTQAENFHQSPPVLSAQADYRNTDVAYSGGTDMQGFGDRNVEAANYGYDQQPEEGETFDSRRESRDGSVSGGDSDGSHDNKRRHNKKRDKKDKRKRKHDERKKKKKKYHDFDSANEPNQRTEQNFKSLDEQYMNAWPGGYGDNKRERGPYDSPGSKEGSPDYYGNEQRLDPRALRPYNSPPGAYDSPDEEDYTDGKRKSKYARMNSTGSLDQEPRSLMSMVADDFFDANVAANEKEELFDRQNKSGRQGNRQRKLDKAKKYREKQQQRDKERADRDQTRREERKRLPCRYYQDGECPRGDDCEFSHDIAKRELSNKKALCKHYMRGGCNRDWCMFMHGDYPCKYYFDNRCEMGDNCRFTHSEMTEETRLILDRDTRETSPKRNGQIRKPGQENRSNSLLGKPGAPGNSSHGRRDHNNFEPPRHVQETMKKIPSLFDIKVEKPKGPTNQNMMAPNMGNMNMGNNMSPNHHQRPGRPGFYNDMMGTPPRMGGHGPHSGPHPGPGLLGPGPRPPGPIQGMNIPPPGFMGPPPGPPPFMQPGNFFGPMVPPPRPPGMMPPRGMNDGQDGQHENKENNMDNNNIQDDWNNQEKADDVWFGNPEESNENTTQPVQPAPPKIDISAMLNMIRNSVVQSASSSPQQSTTTPTSAPAVRDPRSSSIGNDPRSSNSGNDPRSSNIGNDPRASRPDPRAGNRDTNRDVDNRSQPPPNEPPPVQEKTEATFGFAQNQLKDERDRPHEDKVINCSLSYTGGVPYVLYKMTLEVLRPMLPKFVNPSDEKYTDDPRVKSYGRVGQPIAEVQPKMIRPQSRHSSTDSTGDVRPKQLDAKAATPPKIKVDSVSPVGSLGGQEAPVVEEIRVTSLPEGLKKPLIPLPKLLDPRLGRQLSMDVDKKGEKIQSQKSPPASNKPAQPFSHRNDPRFRKKIKARSNSTGDADNLQHQTSSDQIDSLDSDGVSPEKSLESDTKSSTIESSETELKSQSEIDNSEPCVKPLKSGRRDNPMEYATPLGYYSDLMSTNDDLYNSYNKQTPSNKETSNNTNSTKFHFQSDSQSRNSEENVTAPVSTAFDDNNMTSQLPVYTPAEESSYVPMKDMFKTIDPTASPFGSIS